MILISQVTYNYFYKQRVKFQVEKYERIDCVICTLLPLLFTFNIATNITRQLDARN